MHRQIAINVLALEGIGLGAVVDGQAPEVEILILGHGVKHLFQRAHGAHQGRVGHDDLVKLRQLIPAVGIQRRFVGPDIQALVLARPWALSLPLQTTTRSVRFFARSAR